MQKVRGKKTVLAHPSPSPPKVYKKLSSSKQEDNLTPMCADPKSAMSCLLLQIGYNLSYLYTLAGYQHVRR